MRISGRICGGILLAACSLSAPANAAQYRVVYTLQGGADLASPLSIAQGPSGSLFGVAEATDYSVSAVFKLDPPPTGQSEWRYSIIFVRPNAQFHDFITPQLLFDPLGNLYLGTYNPNGGGGSIYRISPPTAGQTNWTSDLLFHHYSAHFPYYNNFYLSYRDSGGCLIGYDPNESTALYGQIFKLSPDGVLTTLSTFGRAVGDGQGPNGMVLGSDGSFYGTTYRGDHNTRQGSVFRLTPPASGQTAWTRHTLYGFGSDGGFVGYPLGLIADRGLTLYGVEAFGGTAHKGSVFRLAPPAAGQTAWQESDLYLFKAGPDGSLPEYGLVNLNGTLFGTTDTAGDPSCNCGTLFKLVAPAAGPQATPWNLTSLHQFGVTPGDGVDPWSAVVRATLPGGATALFGVTIRSVGADGKKVSLGTIYEYVP